MQTFLPFEDFRRSAACLDPARLGKQRIECLLVIGHVQGVRWDKTSSEYVKALEQSNHPTVEQWRKHYPFLFLYTSTIFIEWENRGFSDGLGSRFRRNFAIGTMDLVKPKWLGDERLHSSHRSVLLGKDYAYYSRAGWHETPAKRSANGSWPYFWPSKQKEYSGG